ncbi:MAG: sigma-70 family RNA polymerase sigma factor [Armatimonadota bacterium]|nr:sigma-70 family RNA polymerase sigma factor [Armatimonadota bacterium]MDR7451366.1 sigma-70 family RNA polymerase sigma factor [Armatimonadota bacterium]MDR7466484.1 sigma-70 family RNA polymerase sigma factor [Armatimonadota bacterium]MDR7493206.1 sigma-70 family RNA polymerase sigma factor [Armatimonadota bacterium]MDR7499441.1 sigma-70 family RNA polymerase sigma factor [Armatimonadota bacterium]
MLADYLAELQKIDLLDTAEERDLWYRYRHLGDGDSRLRLIEAYQPLVFKVVMRLRPPEPVVMDMIQEGTIGLIEAVERFDPRRGVRFSTFATYRIRGRVLNALRRGQDVSRQTALNAGLPDPSAEAALLAVEDAAAAERMRAVLSTLPARERTILNATYVEAREPRRVAEELRISLSHFYRLHKQALVRLRGLVGDGPHHLGQARGY